MVGLTPKHSKVQARDPPTAHLRTQVCMLCYLAAAWPYQARSLQLMELGAHTLEVVIFIFALLQMGASSAATLSWVMIGG